MNHRRRRFLFWIVFLALAVGVVETATAQVGASISEPTNGTAFAPTAGSIGASGAATPNKSFVLYCSDRSGGGTVYSSAGVTSDANGNWSTSLPAPTGGWPAGTMLYIYAKNNGVIISDIISIRITNG